MAEAKLAALEQPFLSLGILMVNPEYTSKTLLLYHSFVYCCYFPAGPGSLCFGPNVVPKKSPLFQAGG
jgi:hypothetical protein